MNKHIFIYNLLSSSAVILCSKYTPILSLETEFSEEYMQSQMHGLSEVILYMSPQNFFTCFIISLEFLHINSKSLTDARLPYK